jgi:REP element-mobilizing transposase RayT
VYFITICTYNRAHLFGDIVGATLCGRPNSPDKLIEKWLLEIEMKYRMVKIDHYVIMPDHIHFILTLQSQVCRMTVPQIVDWFKTMTTNDYIRGVKSALYPPFCKHIWQRDYYEHIIRNDDDLSETRRYIDENLAKWQEMHQ